VNGPRGGTATITWQGTLASGSQSVVFDGYTSDGATFVNGTMTVANPDATAAPWTFTNDVRVTGAHTGRLLAHLTVNNNAHPLPRMSGTFRAVYDGRVAPALPPLGPCYSKLPRTTPLTVTTRRHGTSLAVTVTADIDGDRRPVQRALVRVGAVSAHTNGSGRAVLALTAGRRDRLRVTAGDTFGTRTVAVG
jgi:hypothetical protein